MEISGTSGVVKQNLGTNDKNGSTGISVVYEFILKGMTFGINVKQIYKKT
jgi:hypothetical protein